MIDFKRGQLFLILFILIISLLLTASIFASGSGVKIFPLKELKPGMKGVALSVFKGYKLTEFPVEIIDIIPTVSPGKSMILAHVGGAIVEKAGVMQGMSGSPVYIKGKLVGAIASTWSFSIEPLAGVTPIEQMLKIMDYQVISHSEETTTLSTTYNVIKKKSETENTAYQAIISRASSVKNNISIVPDERRTIPLSISGWSGKSLSIIKSVFEPMGFVLVSGGQMGQVTGADIELKPGSAIGLSLISGDLSLAGIGTVTYVNGNKVLAFGHPMFQLGNIEMPMVTAYVHSVMPSKNISFKIASPSKIVGTILQDRASGIYGIIGRKPEVFPIEIAATNLITGENKHFSYKLARNQNLTPILSLITVMQTLSTISIGKGNLSVRIKSRLDLQDMAPIQIENMYSSLNSVFESGVEALSLLSLLTNPYKRIYPQKLTMKIQFEEQIINSEIQEINLEKSQLHPSEELKLRIVIKPYLEKSIIKQVRFKLDPSWAEGVYNITVSDQTGYLRRSFIRSSLNFHPQTFSQLVKLLTKAHDKSKIYITISNKNKGLSLRGETYDNIPFSVLAKLQPKSFTGQGSVTRGSVVAEQELATNSVIHGIKSMFFTLKK